MITMTNYAKDNLGDVLNRLMAEGTGPNALLEIWSGSRPAGPWVNGASNGGVRLCQIPFARPAVAPWSNNLGVASFAGDGEVLASGLASWFRITNRDGIGLLDGDISLVGGGGDLEFDNVNFIESGEAAISAMSFTISC